MLRFTDTGFLSSKFEIFLHPIFQSSIQTELNRMSQDNQMHSARLLNYLMVFRNHLTHVIC